MRWTGRILLLAAALIAAGCNYRDIKMVSTPSQAVYFKLDWSDFPAEELPTGVSIYCYPKDGSSPYVYKSNDIDLVKADMPSGTYDIIAFNQVESEFESFDFTGMDSFSTACVSVRETEKPKWKLVADEPVCTAPEWLAVDRLADYDVSYDLYSSSPQYILLKPESVVYTVESSFHVFGTNKIYTTYGEMSGLSGSLMLGTGEKTMPRCIQLFEDVAISSYTKSLDDGVVTARFHTFGAIDDNWLHYRFFLVDQSTYCNYTFDVSDRIEQDDNLMRIAVNIGFDNTQPQEPEYGADPERPGTLPDVVPKGGASGIDAVVSDWKNEVIINL